MTRSLRKFARMTGRQRLWLAYSAVVVGTFRLALKLLPFKHILGWIDNRVEPYVLEDRTVDRVLEYHVIWSITTVGRRVLGDKPCLPQALAAQWILGRRGYATDLRIGVIKDAEGNLQAHAWLEHGGRILIGGETSPTEYRVLPAFKVRT